MTYHCGVSVVKMPCIVVKILQDLMNCSCGGHMASTVCKAGLCGRLNSDTMNWWLMFFRQ